MKQINLNNIDVTITADNTAFIVDIQNVCFAETYMDGSPCRWPNPADNGRMWGYIKGPANVRIPAPGPGYHELALLIGGRLFRQGHDFHDPNAEPQLEEPKEEPVPVPVEEPAEEPVEEPAEEPAEDPTEEPTEEPAPEPVEEPAEGDKITITLDKQTVLDVVTGLEALIDALKSWMED